MHLMAPSVHQLKILLAIVDSRVRENILSLAMFLILQTIEYF
jgi:hypothetical protein